MALPHVNSVLPLNASNRFRRRYPACSRWYGGQTNRRCYLIEPRGSGRGLLPVYQGSSRRCGLQASPPPAISWPVSRSTRTGDSRLQVSHRAEIHHTVECAGSHAQFHRQRYTQPWILREVALSRNIRAFDETGRMETLLVHVNAIPHSTNRVLRGLCFAFSTLTRLDPLTEPARRVSSVLRLNSILMDSRGPDYLIVTGCQPRFGTWSGIDSLGKEVCLVMPPTMCCVAVWGGHLALCHLLAQACDGCRLVSFCIVRRASDVGRRTDLRILDFFAGGCCNSEAAYQSGTYHVK